MTSSRTAPHVEGLDADTSVPLASGFSIFPRLLAQTGTVTLGASQSLRLTYFRAPETRDVTQLLFRTGGTAAVTPSLIQYGLFSVAVNGDITRIGETPNDTTLLAAINTDYPKALSAPAPIVVGGIFAAGILVVTAVALPTMQGLSLNSAALNGKAYRQAGAVAGQAIMPAFVAAGSIGDSSSAIYVEAA